MLVIVLSLKCPFWEKKAQNGIASVQTHNRLLGHSSKFRFNSWAFTWSVLHDASWSIGEVSRTWKRHFSWNRIRGNQLSLGKAWRKIFHHGGLYKCLSGSGRLWLVQRILPQKGHIPEGSPLAAGHWLKLWLSPYLSEVASSCMARNQLWEDRMGLYSLGFGDQLCSIITKALLLATGRN